MTKSLKEKYNEINSSYTKVLIFHLGIDAGFFSEINYMIDMILYCLENKIQFRLYSKDANFGYKNGWTDYFLPFCKEVDCNIHHKFNRHPHSLSLKEILTRKSPTKEKTALIKWIIKTNIFICIAHFLRIVKIKNRFDYYTHDLLGEIKEKNKIYNIPELGINGNYASAYNVIFDLIWDFNEEVITNKNDLIKSLELPIEYLSSQIRGGDKIIEYNLLGSSLFIDYIRKNTQTKEVFVLTDDYRIIEKLRKDAPEYTWITLCEKEEKGYFNSSFSKTQPDLKKKKMIRFLTSMDILFNSKTFIGTITATPSIVSFLKRYPDTNIIDYDKSLFLESMDLSISQKKEISESFLRNLN